MVHTHTHTPWQFLQNLQKDASICFNRIQIIQEDLGPLPLLGLFQALHLAPGILSLQSAEPAEPAEPADPKHDFLKILKCWIQAHQAQSKNCLPSLAAQVVQPCWLCVFRNCHVTIHPLYPFSHGQHQHDAHHLYHLYPCNQRHSSIRITAGEMRRAVANSSWIQLWYGRKQHAHPSHTLWFAWNDPARVKAWRYCNAGTKLFFACLYVVYMFGLTLWVAPRACSACSGLQTCANG